MGLDDLVLLLSNNSKFNETRLKEVLSELSTQQDNLLEKGFVPDIYVKITIDISEDLQKFVNLLKYEFFEDLGITLNNLNDWRGLNYLLK